MHTDEGHRQRTKKRFLDEGLENFNEIHALELLLFYAIPRRDTKQIARDLINKFGTFDNVLDADRRSLETVKGVGPGVSCFLSLINQTVRYYRVNRGDERPVLDDINTCTEYLMNYFCGTGTEQVYLLCLDGKCRMISCLRLCEGDAMSVSISVRQVVETAMNVGAASVVLAHNHPKGSLRPSADDVAVTRRIATSLAAMGILLLDHLIFCNDESLSMAQAGHYDVMEFENQL